MQRAGLTEHAIGSVATALASRQRNGRARPSQRKIRDLIASVGAEPSSTNLARAEPVYLRALGEALLQSADRYGSDPLPFDDLVAEITGPAVPPRTQASPAVSGVPTPAEWLRRPPKPFRPRPEAGRPRPLRRALQHRSPAR